MALLQLLGRSGRRDLDAARVYTVSNDERTSHWLVRRVSSSVSENINLYIATYNKYSTARDSLSQLSKLEAVARTREF
jgi:biotin carboxylase